MAKEEEVWPKIQKYSNEELTRFHNAAMEILRDVGVVFHDPEAVNIFQKHGVRVEGKTVFIDESLVTEILETIPSQFTLTARDREKSVKIGGENVVFLPGYGSLYIVTKTGERRDARMEDYNNFCKLVQTSGIINMNGFMMIQPSDIAPETSCLDMLLSSMTLCDKPFLGPSLSRQAAKDCMKMATILLGEVNKPVIVSNISAISPLQFSIEMVGALIEFASCGQPLVIRGGGIRGATGPISFAGSLALQNAEILAGVTLVQLVNPGTPVVYGAGFAPMDMRSAKPAYGSPEFSMALSAGVQMAKFYNLPSRGLGSNTEAHLPDMQAGMESAIALHTAVISGCNVLFLACGALSSYNSMSYEKFLADEELCGMVKRFLKPDDISDEAIDLKSIKDVGIGGEYLTHPNTFQHCRTEFFSPNLMSRQDYETWEASGKKRLDEVASLFLLKRLEAYEKPEIDPEVEQDLILYVADRKKGLY